jgi:conjugative relaxase-like TrwC/TraI family protein
MLRINTSYGIGPKTYFLSDDRFSLEDGLTGKERALGTWFGKGAERLGLSGRVDKESFVRLCDNTHPWTHEMLTIQTRHDRRVGFDLNFHVPKSVSVYHALTGDDRVLEAFKDAVRSTMRDIEAEVQTRVRRGGEEPR